MQGIFVDTGGWYATIVRKDHDHDAARQFLADNDAPLLTSDYVMDETVTLLQSRVGHNYAAADPTRGGVLPTAHPLY